MKRIDFDEISSRLLIVLVLAFLTVLLVLLGRISTGWLPGTHTMQPDCRDVSSVDPAHEYRNNPEPPR